MFVIDVKSLAESIIVPDDIEDRVKPALLESVVLLAVRAYNTELTQGELDEVLGELITDANFSIADLVYADMLKFIVTNTKRCGWDRRLKIKATVREVKGVVHQVIVLMDLDSTIKAFNNPKPKRKVLAINEVVDDNPDIDLINCLLFKE